MQLNIVWKIIFSTQLTLQKEKRWNCPATEKWFFGHSCPFFDMDLVTTKGTKTGLFERQISGQKCFLCPVGYPEEQKWGRVSYNFIFDIPEILIVTKQYINANDSKVRGTKSKSTWTFQYRKSNLPSCITTSKKGLASDECTQWLFNGESKRKVLNEQQLRMLTTVWMVWILGVVSKSNLTSS